MTDAAITSRRVTGTTARTIQEPSEREVNRLSPLANRPTQLDYSRPLQFTFDGKAQSGLAGDTVASALLANGTNFVARSFKYHRPRGIFTAGPEEPNALLTIGEGAASDPNSRATMVELHEGLVARSQNNRGSLKHDLMAANDLLSPFLSAGFYYKTFMWPRAFWEKLYEPVIRMAAGLGALSGEHDPDSYDHGYLHCDVLVVGSGPAGLSAALAAGRAGARVILVEEDFVPGGRLNAETMAVDDLDSAQWAANAVAELQTLPNVRVMTRTCAFGAYDHGVYGLLETRPSGGPRQVLWRVYSKRAILCAGALERPIGFAGNDRPGVMLASAVRTYANRFDVTPGQRVAVLTSTDDGYRTARDLAARGVKIAAVLDTRAEGSSIPSKFEVIHNARIDGTSGRHGLRSLTLANGKKIYCDCLAVSGGHNPNVHLTCHQHGRPVWDEQISAFVPGDTPPGQSVAGSANGVMTLGACLRDGHEAGNAAARDTGFDAKHGASAHGDDEASGLIAFYQMPSSGKGRAKAFVDLQNDVTTKDISQSHLEGMTSVEHLKRYTTLGMATDQGKTSNITGLAVMAELTGASIAQTGTTMFRPPVSPVAIGAFAGHARGKHFRPTRLTPSHDWAQEQGAVFVETGQWLRAQYFPTANETHWRESVDREVKAVRNCVGVCDVTTLGKIDVQGPDAAAFLNRVYANGFAKLAIGKCRYGLMLREDGIVMDDGTAARMAEHHFFVTTTTANAGSVFQHMEFCRQCLWPELNVHLVSTTEAWAQFAVAGPRSRELLQRLVDAEHDISNAAFPFMACGDISVCGGTPARLFRISFSGEMAYEIAVPARYGDALIRALMEAGRDLGVTAYGTEALGVLRIEKGHAAGNELDGRTTARDLGLGRMISTKEDSIGAVLSRRAGLSNPNGHDLVGFKPIDADIQLTAGAHLVGVGDPVDMDHDQGWLSSACFSPTLGHSIALGFLKNGTQRMGETVVAANPLEGLSTQVQVVSPHFVDPKGERMRG